MSISKIVNDAKKGELTWWLDTHRRYFLRPGHARPCNHASTSGVTWEVYRPMGLTPSRPAVLEDAPRPSAVTTACDQVGVASPRSAAGRAGSLPRRSP